MVPRGNLYVMDHASHHLQEERPQAYYSVVSGFLDSVPAGGVPSGSLAEVGAR
jgi:hypothetical protein